MMCVLVSEFVISSPLGRLVVVALVLLYFRNNSSKEFLLHHIQLIREKEQLSLLAGSMKKKRI